MDLLNNTKAAWEGYYAGLENIAIEFEKAEEQIKKVKKMKKTKNWTSISLFQHVTEQEPMLANDG